MGLRNAGINFQQYEETHLMETPDFSVESPTLAHQEDKQAETAINRQGAAISYRHFSFKRVSDCQKADAEGVCGLFVTGRECSRLTRLWRENTSCH